jgi:hypothetical protein
VWDSIAVAGFQEILDNAHGRFTHQAVDLIKTLRAVLGEGSLLAYLTSLTLRLTELQRVLKPTGCLYLHCDPTASHYLKLVLDAIFCAQGGAYLNEIIWKRTNARSTEGRWPRVHDVLFFYSKSSKFYFLPLKVAADKAKLPHTKPTTLPELASPRMAKAAKRGKDSTPLPSVGIGRTAKPSATNGTKRA